MTTKVYHLQYKVLNGYLIPAAEEIKTGSGVTFSEFLRFIVDEGRYSLISKDWMSIHDMCHPCLVKYNYIAKLETINPDSTFLLHRTSNQIGFPEKHISPKSDSNMDNGSTDVFHRYYSSVPSNVLDGIRKLYALDFKMFGYDINKGVKHGRIQSANECTHGRNQKQKWQPSLLHISVCIFTFIAAYLLGSLV